MKYSDPDVLSTYLSILTLLAKEIREQKISGFKPRLIPASGETPTINAENEIREAFNSNIFGTYGAEEFSILAFECNKHTGYHVKMPTIQLLEIFSDYI